MSEKMRQSLLEDFHDPEFRQIYLRDFLNSLISTQIRVLREDRNLSQAQLAASIGTTQPAVSAHESPDKDSWSIATLRKLAEAFDVALIVKFESFGKALNEITGFSRESLSVPSFEDDPAFRVSAQSTWMLLPHVSSGEYLFAEPSQDWWIAKGHLPQQTATVSSQKTITSINISVGATI